MTYSIERRRTLVLALIVFAIAAILLECVALDAIDSFSDSKQMRSIGRQNIPLRKNYTALSFNDLNMEYSSSPSLFNTIHSSMRQFGSSLNHNGISVFPATVPAGTMFFHGRNDANLPGSPEWLGFEMEQANVFARSSRPQGPRRPPRDTKDGDARVTSRATSQSQFTVDDVSEDDSVPQGGFMHTFRTTRDLRLIYLDGMAAGKSSLGTMDLTNIILNWSLTRGGSDNERAVALCDWQKSRGYQLDGIIRMEQNFEIIFCDFRSDALDLVNTVQKAESRGPQDTWTSWEFSRVAERRYHGIGSSRVKVDYTGMVSFYGSEAAERFNYTDGLPRLTDLEDADEDRFFDEVDEVFRSTWTTETRNWQDIADSIVTLYSTKLRVLLHYSANEDETRFEASLTNMLVPFVDHRLPEPQRRTRAIAQCTYEYLPLSLSTARENKLFTAFEQVTTTICITLLHLQDSPTTALSRVHEILVELMDHLRWTTWKECIGCQPEELCIVPMWPFGGPGDRTPNCVKEADYRSDAHRGYWSN